MIAGFATTNPGQSPLAEQDNHKPKTNYHALDRVLQVCRALLAGETLEKLYCFFQWTAGLHLV